MTVSKKTRSEVFSPLLRIILALFFTVAIILPLAFMLVNLGDADLQKIFSGGKVYKAIINSLSVSLTATVFALVLAILAAYSVERSNIKFKGFFHTLALLPMLIPSISHGMGLIILFGDNGTLTRLFGLSKGIYGFWGIVVGSVMYAFPVAYLMIIDLLKYEDALSYESARVFGLSPIRRFTAVTLPYLRKPMISVFFATFTLIVTDYGVPIMIGGMYKTLPVLMYEEVIGKLDFAKGSVFGMILLIPALIAFLVDLLMKRGKRGSGVTKRIIPEKNRLRDALAYLFMGLVSLLVFYPIASFGALSLTRRYPADLSITLDHVISSFSKGAGDYFVNSLLIAILTAALGTVVAFLCAYTTAREKKRGSGFLHLMSMISLAVPGMVLGISYVVFFSKSFLYGTFAILILANTVHFFSSPYLMLYNSMGGLDENLEAVGETLGISRVRIMLTVVLGQTRATVVEVFSYFFVNSMMTISAVAFLSNIRTSPLSLMIPQFEAQMLLEASAFVSLMILFTNLLMKVSAYFVKKILSRRRVIKNAD